MTPIPPTPGHGMTGDQAAAILRMQADLFLLMEEAAIREAEAEEPDEEKPPPKRQRKPRQASRTIVGEP